MIRTIARSTLAPGLHWMATQAEWILGTSRRVHGIPVRIYAVASEDHDHLRALLSDGLDYLAKYSPRQYKQLRQRIRRVSIRSLPHLQGQFEESGPAIILAEHLLERAAEFPAKIASTLVHETAHARLHQLGIRYTEQTSIRVEQACIREELRFLSQAPAEDTAGLMEVIRLQHRDAAKLWSRESRFNNTEQALATVDAPLWLRRFFHWLGSRRHAA